MPYSLATASNVESFVATKSSDEQEARRILHHPTCATAVISDAVNELKIAPFRGPIAPLFDSISNAAEIDA